ncbi:MAG: 50S ribosomal protein L13 [Chlamydiia bacterium]|nr:50S ribosomal protein L13 [Chlamydiia bacterium]
MTNLLSSKSPKLGRTSFPEKKSTEWFLVDAKNRTLGRLSTLIKSIITGKHTVMYSDNIDNGDGVIVINAKQVRLTGNKKNSKQYYSHSKYVGSAKFIPFSVMIDKDPERVIKHAVKGMMRRGPLANKQLKNLRVFADANHTFESQKPHNLMG